MFSLKNNEPGIGLSDFSRVFPNDNISFHSSVAGKEKRPLQPTGTSDWHIFLTENLPTVTSSACFFWKADLHRSNDKAGISFNVETF